MLSFKSKIICAISIFLTYFLMITETTSADIFAERVIRQNRLQATTLSFSDRNTANNIQIYNLFSLMGLLPGGFDIKAVRIKKDGRMSFKYHMKAVKKAGDDILCNSLNIEVFPKGGGVKYQGNLMNLSINSTISDQGIDNWIFLLSLDDDNINLKNKSCEFELVVNTYRNNPNENPYGFRATRSLYNNIIAGNW